MCKKRFTAVVAPLYRSLGIEQQVVVASPNRGGWQVVGVGLAEILGQHGSSVAMH